MRARPSHSEGRAAGPESSRAGTEWPLGALPDSSLRLIALDSRFRRLIDPAAVISRVSGPGEIAGVDNGNAATTDPFQANRRRAFNGLALAIIRSRPGESGKIELHAEAETLMAARTTIAVKP